MLPTSAPAASNAGQTREMPYKAAWLLAGSAGVMASLAIYIGWPLLHDWLERRAVAREIEILSREAEALRLRLDGD
jgi:hypothetical protein